MAVIAVKFEATKKRKAMKVILDRLVYTFCGFDTNSAVYKQGKLPVVKPLEKFETLREEADLLLPRSRTPGTIYEAWMRMFVMLCCGKASDSLTDLKYLNENGFISRTIK